MALMRRARAGDPEALPELRRTLEHAPTAAAFFDLSACVRAAWLRLVAGNDLLLRDLAARELDQLRAALLGPAPTAVERLLADRVAVAWLQVQEADLRLTADRDGRAGEAPQRRADHATRRFLAAVRALTTVRRLSAPACQVHVTERLVNITG
jgi:hypothetical protein